jgi:5'-3' exonuclease
MKVHVDGDVVVYRAGFAAEHNIYHVHWVEDGLEKVQSFDGKKAFAKWLDANPGKNHWVENETQVEPEQACLYNVHSILKSIANDLQVDKENDLIVYLSGPTNYRTGVATIKPYKGNRDPTKKPVHAPAIKELMRNRYNAITTDGIEADDAMATAHYAMWQQDEMSSVIATIDKDLDTVPGLHHNFAREKPEERSYYVTPEEARIKFWKQMITGDTIDNIPGIPGAGPSKADKALGGWDGVDEREAYEIVRGLYVQSYKDKADEALLEMGRLLWIQRKPDDWWNPPSGVSEPSPEQETGRY